MNTKIVVDSSASLYTLQGVDFECVPLKIITDDAEYLDNGTMDALGMAQTLRTYKGKTSTSCPNVSDWLAAYEGADEVYAITITGTLSGSYNAAQLAAEEYQQENPGKRVFVLDSLSTGPEQRLLAEHLRDLLAEGKEFDEICEEMLRYHKHTHLLFSLESLANLARNGRVKPAVAAVARMLGIRVIGQASEAGELDVLCKTRGEHGALERIVLELKEHGYTNGRLHISHCGNPAAAERLKHMVKAVFDGAKVDISECGGLCSYYAELGGALYLAFGNKAPAKYLRERMQKVEQAHQTELAQPEGQTDALDISSRNLSRYVAKFGPYPAWRDTAAHYFSCGEEMYPQLLADLDKAEKFIFLEFFILRSGKMWDGVEQILRRKAAQGVDVRLIYDDFGSLLGLPSDFVIRMEKAHIRCIPFNPVVPLVSLVMNHRDHRKIVVVDGNVAYTGGVNLADEYINAEQRFGYWKDAAIRLEGAAVWNFTVMFLNVWNAFRPQETDYTAFAPTRLPAVQDGVVQPYADSPLDEEPLAETVYLDLLSQAQR